MNINLLKRFSQDSRRKLMEQIGSKLDFVLNIDSSELRSKSKQIETLKEELFSIGREQLIEKVSYTWFNRFVALRFLDVNDYQPIGYGVLSAKEGYHTPELLNEVKRGQIPNDLRIDKDRVYKILDGKISVNNPENEVYRMLLVSVCNNLNSIFPFLFERINDYTELLLPDDLTSEFSIINDVREGMTIEDCQEVEIMGWLYQFYISEKKDEVFASKKKVKKEDIPSVTQLFTPRWVVEYMVQNTIGKLWVMNHPQSKLRDSMEFFIESDPKLTKDNFLQINSVEELTLLDPSSGSGHILVYGFDLLYKIYEEEGYNPSEIPNLIIKNNLFGYEIDERASQLSSLTILLKGREYNRRFFKKEIQEPNILCYKDLKLTDDEIHSCFQIINEEISEELKYDLNLTKQSTNLGSLIIPHSDCQTLKRIKEKIKSKLTSSTDLFYTHSLNQLLVSISQLEQLSQKFSCVVTNPPYMGGGNMNKELSNFVKSNYSDSKSDLMTCFMEVGLRILHQKGLMGMINLPSWLFLSSFEKLRKSLIKNQYIDSLLHMGRGIFGVDWGSTSFIIINSKIDGVGTYFKLHERNFQHIYPDDIKSIFLKSKENHNVKINFKDYRDETGLSSIDELIDPENGLQLFYQINQKNFEKISGSPIGYWLSKKQRKILSETLKFNDVSSPCTGMQTGSNDIFTRYWYEVSLVDIGYYSNHFSEIWCSYQMGGDSVKWAGKKEKIIRWENNGESVINHKSSVIRNKSFYGKKGISWKRINSSENRLKVLDEGQIFDQSADSLFPNSEDEFYYQFGYLNSKVLKIYLELFSPTLNLTAGTVKDLPVYIFNKPIVIELTRMNENITKNYNNSSENVNEFKENPLLQIKSFNIKTVYEIYQNNWSNNFYQLHQNEEEINKQFINIYGLEDELKPDVSLEDITILKEETYIKNGELKFNGKEIFEQFISYSVGVQFGRYSLEKEGLILCNLGETLSDYIQKVEKQKEEITFSPDDDNIIPILDDEWFEDDIVGRFYEFLKVTFGEENFPENLQFVERQIGKNIRKYFVKDFYNSHIKRYKKRPIYWMFSSPKHHFNVLIYLHRYNQDTLNVILNKYLRKFVEKLKIRKQSLENLMIKGSTSEQNISRKEVEGIEEMILDCENYERNILYPLASERITIDLDDGVLVNYNKFGNSINEVKGLNDFKTKKKVKGFDWIDNTQIV